MYTTPSNAELVSLPTVQSIPAVVMIWPQPLDPLHSLLLSALVAAIPLIVVLILMGGLRKSSLLASACGLAGTIVLALGVWRMPVSLLSWSILFGLAYAVLPILWMVFGGLYLYNLAVATGSFDLLRQWMENHASGDPCIQAMLVAFCFGALLEGTTGFGAPVAVTAFLLVRFGFEPRKAVMLSLLANTAPVAFGGIGVPIIALSGATGLDINKLSAMIGRQLPFLSFILPAYLAWMVAGRKGLRRCWPEALIAGGSFAIVQCLVANLWGPYAADLLSSLVSIVAVVGYRRIVAGSQKSRDTGENKLSAKSVVLAWLPWALLSVVMVFWSYFKLFQTGQILIPIPKLHNGALITLYQKSYAAVYALQPLAAGTGILVSTVLTAACLRAKPKVVLESGARTLQQLKVPGLTVLFIVGLTYLYNYSGMAFTLGAALARAGSIFPLVSSYLGWVACFLSGSDTAANLLFGNLQVAAAHQLHLSPILLAATNSSGAVAGKMISPQNIAVGVTTVGLIGQEGKVLYSTFWHSVLMAVVIGLIACVQAYLFPGLLP